MTREEFEIGIPFKRLDIEHSVKLTNVYSYVNVGGVKCIQEYTFFEPSKPRFHCTVVNILDDRVLVSVNICGQAVPIIVYFNHLQAIADKMGRRIVQQQKEKEEPLARYTRDCREAQVFRVWDDPNMFYVKIIDLYDGRTEPGKRLEYYDLESAKVAAKKEIGYEE